MGGYYFGIFAGMVNIDGGFHHHGLLVAMYLIVHLHRRA